MSMNHDRYRATPSVLNRLLPQDVDARATYGVAQLREDIRRDVENLLNTRAPFLFLPKDQFAELATSLCNYGRPDLGMLKTNQELERFRKQIEDGLRFWEPRFHTISVELTGLPTATDRSLKLRIRSTLRLEPQFSFDFDSDLNMATGECLLRIR